MLSDYIILGAVKFSLKYEHKPKKMPENLYFFVLSHFLFLIIVF